VALPCGRGADGGHPGGLMRRFMRKGDPGGMTTGAGGRGARRCPHPEVTPTPGRGAGTPGGGTQPPQQHPRGCWAGVPCPPLRLGAAEGLIQLLSRIWVLLDETVE